MLVLGTGDNLRWPGTRHIWQDLGLGLCQTAKNSNDTILDMIRELNTFKNIEQFLRVPLFSTWKESIKPGFVKQLKMLILVLNEVINTKFGLLQGAKTIHSGGDVCPDTLKKGFLVYIWAVLRDMSVI